MNVKLKLYILSFNKHLLEYDVVSISDDTIEPLIYDLTENTSIDAQIKKLFEDHIDLSFEYIRVNLTDTYIDKNILNIVYYCLIPFQTKTKNCFLLPINPNAIHSKNLRKIINCL